MSDASPFVTIKLDPQNPAQFFACCGLCELVSAGNESALACFECDPRQPRQARFNLQGVGAPRMSAAMSALKAAEVTAIADFAAGEAPVRLAVRGFGVLVLDWWLVPERNNKSDFKLWAGQQTTLKLVQDMLSADWDLSVEGVLDHRLPMSGRFGLDPRSAWNTLDFGSSPNTQNRDAYTYPATEMLAAVGLQGFRPSQQTRKGFLYSLWSSPLPLTVARAAAAGVLSKMGNYDFEFEVAKRSGAYSYFTFAQPLEE